jgi:DNA ligase-1
MHAQNWDRRQDLNGWLLSEKMDGVRAYWDGKSLYSRKGKPILAPSSFTDALPKEFALDGELWLGRDSYEKLVAVQNSSDSDWSKVKYFIFDLPNVEGRFEVRIETLKQIELPLQVIPVEFTKCEGNEHLKQYLDQVVALGGEGLMAHRPDADYIVGRNSSILKVKVELVKEVVLMLF